MSCLKYCLSHSLALISIGIPFEKHEICMKKITQICILNMDLALKALIESKLQKSCADYFDQSNQHKQDCAKLRSNSSQDQYIFTSANDETN